MRDEGFHAVTWTDVAPLLARWQICLAPQADRSWDVYTDWGATGLPRHDARGVAFSALPQAIADVAARCEAGEQGGKE